MKELHKWLICFKMQPLQITIVVEQLRQQSEGRRDGRGHENKASVSTATKFRQHGNQGCTG